MIRVGIAGIGFMGWIHWLAYQQIPGVEVTAICETDPSKRSGDWRAIQGNFGPPGQQVDLSNVSVHPSIESFLADSSIDVVDVCLPPSLHPDVAVAAILAGRDVFCEKPLALSVDACEQMVQQADLHHRQLLVGHVLPFFPEYRYALERIKSGELGAPIGGSFKRVISDPTWLQDFYDPRLIGGPLLDLHVHDAHWIRLVFGMPTSLHSVGRWRDQSVEYCNTIYSFSNPNLVVSSVMGVINQQGRPFNHGFEIHLEGATMQFEFAAFADEGETMPLKILTHDGKIERPDLGPFDPVNAFVAELSEVTEAFRSGKTPPKLSGDLARDAVVLCHQQTESVRLGLPVAIDSK